MLTVFIITAAFTALYFIYPLWLKSQSRCLYSEEEKNEPDGVSIVYLSQNSESSLSHKIDFLLNEMNDFTHTELLLVDDGSEDRSIELLGRFKDNRLRVLSEKVPKGIAHSMNLGVELSKFEIIVFCDQRQHLSKGIIGKIVDPLQYSEIGAVSSCISNVDKNNRFSYLRAHENFIKKEEGKTGNLIGVYGPLYALKKKCYKPIPEYIILDDLYLSLNILGSKKIVFMYDCQISDENMDLLYTYKRTKRYVTGFIQILKEKKLLAGLSAKQITMFFWHKYLRIVLPVLFLISYIMLAANAFKDSTAFLFFLIISVFIAVALFPSGIKNRSQLGSIFRLITFYSVAVIEMLILTIIKKNVNE